MQWVFLKTDITVIVAVVLLGVGALVWYEVRNRRRSGAYVTSTRYIGIIAALTVAALAVWLYPFQVPYISQYKAQGEVTHVTTLGKSKDDYVSLNIDTTHHVLNVKRSELPAVTKHDFVSLTQCTRHRGDTKPMYYCDVNEHTGH